MTTREEIEAAERLERATSEEGFMSSYPDDSKYDYGTDVDIVVHAVLRAKADRSTRKAAIERAAIAIVEHFAPYFSDYNGRSAPNEIRDIITIHLNGETT